MSDRPFKLILRPAALRFFVGTVLGMLLGGLQSTLLAFTVRAPGFENLVADADQVLRVQVTASSSRWDDAAVGGQRVIHTYVECRVLRTLKGPASSTVTLRFFGGRVEGAEMHVPDMPTLEVGNRYIVFLRRNGQAFCPLLAAMYGDYRLQTDPSTGAEHVLRGNGEPLSQTQDVGRPMRQTVASASAVSVPAVAMTREQFETSIINQLAHGAPK